MRGDPNHWNKSWDDPPSRSRECPPNPKSKKNQQKIPSPFGLTILDLLFFFRWLLITRKPQFGMLPPLKTNISQTKNDGWFRCISYWNSPFKKGTFVSFLGCYLLLFSQQPGHWSKSGLGRAGWLRPLKLLGWRSRKAVDHWSVRTLAPWD